MSYRDIRTFTEMMQELGYPRLISMENFRTPNFPLVAEILSWLVKRFDPETEIPLEISSESERINLIRSVAEVLVRKTNLKLSTKRLYQADGYAVKEILKITTLLHDSLKSTNSKNKDLEDLPEISIVATAMKLQELKSAVQLVGEIVTSGASLHELLGKEADLRDIRNSKAFRHIEISQVEKAVKDSIEAVRKEIDKTMQSIEEMKSNETSLDTKIEKKKLDLERHYKRLQTLKKIRPAFMEEFEKLEDELKELYTSYVIKYRNMVYLECILEQTESAAYKKIDQRQVNLEIARKLIEDLKDDESVRSGEIESDIIDEIPITKTRLEPAFDLANGNVKKTNDNNPKPRKTFGEMTGGGNNSESQDSDSDLLLDGDVTVDDDEDDDDDDDEDLQIESHPVKNFSDDDF